MAKEGIPPKIVLLGRQSNSKDKRIVDGILSKIEPSDIPSKFLHAIVINTTNGNRYNVADKKKDISYTHIDKYIAQLGLNEPIESVEIVIDLDKVGLHLEEESAIIFKNVFKK